MLPPPMPGMGATQPSPASTPSMHASQGQMQPSQGGGQYSDGGPANQMVGEAMHATDALDAQVKAFAMQYPMAAEELGQIHVILQMAMKKILIQLAANPAQPGPQLPM